MDSGAFGAQKSVLYCEGINEGFILIPVPVPLLSMPLYFSSGAIKSGRGSVFVLLTTYIF